MRLIANMQAITELSEETKNMYLSMTEEELNTAKNIIRRGVLEMLKQQGATSTSVSIEFDHG